MTQERSSQEEIHVPGTLTLALIFLVWFATFYFLAWYLLAKLWPVS